LASSITLGQVLETYYCACAETATFLVTVRILPETPGVLSYKTWNFGNSATSSAISWPVFTKPHFITYTF